MSFVAVALRGMAVVLIALVAVASPQAAAPPAAAPQVAARSGDDAARWVATALDEIAAHRTSPPRAARSLALVSVAIREASWLPPGHRGPALAVLRPRF